MLAEQKIPHRKPAKDCRSSELSVWGSELDSNCRYRRGGKINGSSESFSKAAFLPKDRHIRIPPSPRATLHLPRARLARWPPGSRQSLLRRRHASATFVAARIRSLFEPVNCVRISRNPTLQGYYAFSISESIFCILFSGSSSYSSSSFSLGLMSIASAYRFATHPL